MTPGELDAALKARVHTIRARREEARSRTAPTRPRARPRRNPISSTRFAGIAGAFLFGILLTLGTATIFANEALDEHLCDAADINADIAADGFTCTYLFNKGQGTDSEPIGELYVKRDASDNLILVTDLYASPDTGHVDAKLCVDDDTDPINLSVSSPDDPDKSCLGGTAADVISEGDPLKDAADPPEEGAGLYEVMIDELVEGTYNSFAMFDVFVDGYTEFSLHFNQGAFSIEAFFQADPPGTKEGTKFEDLNADGDDEGGTDPALGGWTINAYADDGDGILSQDEFDAGAVASDVTDAVDGSYLLTLTAGDYIVCEVQQAGWTQSYPTDAHPEAADCSVDASLGPVGYAITIASGDALTGNDFGNFAPGTKSGTKFDDPNGDGDLTDGIPLPGWTINAYADDGDGILSATEYGAGAAATATTDASGDYTLTLDPGDYIVCEVQQAGWTQSFPTAATPEAADCTSVSGATDLAPVGYAITIASGDALTDNDFGNFELFEGCTPGFWKVPQHHDSWAATGFTTGQTLESVFDVPDSLALDDRTLLEALNFRGGSTIQGAAEILLRASVAAVLNAAHPDVNYPFTVAEVIADVNAALATLDRATILALAAELDAANNAGCPLS